ncbi:MAG: hypothetical protein HY096_08025 [Nitrospinae bacterium]|nr:hypothetical protein [Nitrospinota bacterium]
MKKVSHNDKKTQEIIEKFCQQVFWLKSIHWTYKELFESEEAKRLMEKTAHSFFEDINIIFINYLLLEFAKITDPAKTYGEENFTIDNIIESICWPPEVEQKLKDLNNETEKFRKYIKKARNKLLAHRDKKTILSDKILGEFPEGEEERFLTNLEEICNITHEACFNSIFGKIVPSSDGDVLDLKKALKKALVFKRLHSESNSIEELVKLNKYLQEV